MLLVAGRLQSRTLQHFEICLWTNSKIRNPPLIASWNDLPCSNNRVDGQASQILKAQKATSLQRDRACMGKLKKPDSNVRIRYPGDKEAPRDDCKNDEADRVAQHGLQAYGPNEPSQIAWMPDVPTGDI